MSDQREFWERRATAWDERADVLGAFADSFGRLVMGLLGLQPGERVLDVGCGPGVTTLELAELVGPDGEVVGVDIAEGMIAAARRRAGASAGAIRFVVGDAQTAALGSGFDAVFSRFGVMFFVDPTAAFANLVRALRPGGRFAAAVWSELGDNPWMFLPTMAALGPLGAAPELPGPGEPGPFSLADRDGTVALLEGAGFTDVGVEPIEGVLELSEADADHEVRALLGAGPVAEAFEAADEDGRQAAVAAVLAAIEPYRSGAGWRLPALALAVRGVRAG